MNAGADRHNASGSLKEKAAQRLLEEWGDIMKTTSSILCAYNMECCRTGSPIVHPTCILIVLFIQAIHKTACVCARLTDTRDLTTGHSVDSEGSSDLALPVQVLPALPLHATPKLNSSDSLLSFQTSLSLQCRERLLIYWFSLKDRGHFWQSPLTILLLAKCWSILGRLQVNIFLLPQALHR